ncbi:MAG: NAD(P)-dependent alcohol dehydrogenase [Anaerolinea sp.]|nr:NAD(P)-dependent alcohol dehydrogenase [Anaerolinea sp.]
MRAIVQHRYGGPEVLRLEEVDPPTITDDRVLVRVRAASVNAIDWHLLRGKPFLARVGEGARAPKQPIRGVDLAGVVEDVGSAVTRFKPGDEVFGSGVGTFAELATAREPNLARKPADLSFEEAAAVSVAGQTALQGLRDKGGVRAGQRVLVDGAGGGVGTFAVQIARALGAEVTALTRTASLDVVRSLGAARVLDHASADIVRDPARYDVIFDVGGFRTLGELARAAVPGGIVVLCGAGANAGGWIGPLPRLVAPRLRPRIGDVRILFFLASLRQDDLLELTRLLETGVVRPVIDRTYRLEETAEAIRHVEEGRARGKVVITV